MALNIYDEKRRNSVEAYCEVHRLTVTERCIQLEDRISWLERELDSTAEFETLIRLLASKYSGNMKLSRI